MSFLKFFTILGLIFFGVACAPAKPTDVVARVDGDPLFVSDLLQVIYRERDRFGIEATKDKKRFLKMKETLLEELIRQTLLRRMATEQGVVVSDQELEKELRQYKSRYTESSFQNFLKEKKIDYSTWREVKRTNLIIAHWVREKLFVQPGIPEEKKRAYYEEHIQEFTRPESVHVRQIVTETRGAAEAILKKLKAGESFAQLAIDLSISPDRLQGGDLGFISRGRFPKEFDICFDLKVGELSPVVPSLYGFHLFKVVEKHPEKRFSFKEVEKQIQDWLTEEAREEAFRKYYEELRKKAKIEIKKDILRKIYVTT